MTLTQLHLAPTMAQRAAELQNLFPSVVFLSGRRDLESQAHAMSCQVVTDRRWIRKTYLHAAALQSAVDAHPSAKTVEALQEVLYQTLLAMDSPTLSHVSDHLQGDAVDLVPMEDAQGLFTPTGQAVYIWIHDCPDTKTFLTREGGKVIWHWSCRASAEV